MIKSGGRRTQPQHAARIAPEFKGSLVHALNGALASLTQIYDHAQQKVHAVQAAPSGLITPGSVGYGKYGKYLITDYGSSGAVLGGGQIVLNDAFSRASAGDQYTVIAHVRRTAAVENGIFGPAFGAAIPANTTQLQWWSDNNHYFDIHTGADRVVYNDPEAGDLVRAYTWDGAANRKIIYKNGIAVVEDTADLDAIVAGTAGYYALGNGLGCYSLLVFNKVLDRATVAALSNNPWLVYASRERQIYVNVAASGAQNLTPALYPDADTFFAATVTPGSVALTPALYADADTFYATTVSLNGTAQTLTPSLFTDADTFYAATVTPGAVSITPSLYTDADTFHAATVAAGYNLQPSAFSDSDTFYAATVSQSVPNLAPALFVDGDTFYSPSVSGGSQPITPALYTNSSEFYEATLADQSWRQVATASSTWTDKPLSGGTWTTL